MNLPASLPRGGDPPRRGRGKRPRSGAEPVRRAKTSGKTAPALPASLDIQVGVPGRIFVRGRGLDSEWRGQLAIGGTSDAPQITGSLQAIRGTFDVLGKTFRVTQGEISFWRRGRRSIRFSTSPPRSRRPTSRRKSCCRVRSRRRS